MDEDDDWLEAGPSNQGSSADPLVEQEYQRLATRYSDAGYREGITDGKLATLQQGFDSSFAASVPPSRRLGRLRGQANALLASLTRTAPTTSSSRTAITAATSGKPSVELVSAAREIVQELARVKRVQVLPRDLERERHEQEEHGGEDTYELDPTDGRELEGLEDALGSLGGKRTDEGLNGMREGVLLDHFEQRLSDLKRRIKA